MCLLGKCRAWLRKRGMLHLINLIVGFGLHVCDVGFDIYVAIQYAKRDEWWWFAFTLAFVMLPVIVTFSVYSDEIDEDSVCDVCGDILAHAILSLFIVLINYVEDFCVWKRKYWDNKLCIDMHSRCMRYSCEYCEEYRKRQAESSHDLAFARYLETMSESAPQWCLQNYVMLRQWYFPWYTVLSTVFSFLSLAWSITSLEKANKLYRWFYQSYPTTSLNTVFFAWQLCSLLSRLSALVFFAYVFRYQVFVFFGLHIILLTIAMHITQQYYDFIPFDTRRLFFRLLMYMATLYCLTFHISGSVIETLKYDLKHRGLVSFLYQIVVCFENILLVSLAVWHAPAGTTHRATHNKHLEIIVLCFVFVGLVLSIIFMALYYQCFHPSKTLVQNCEGKSTHSGDVEQECVDSTVLQYETGM